MEVFRDLLKRIEQHPKWSSYFISEPQGPTAADLSNLELVSLDQQTVLDLRKRGINVMGAIGPNNVIMMPKDSSFGSLTLKLHGNENFSFLLGRAPNLRGWLSIEGPDHLVVFSGSRGAFNLEVTMRGRGGAFFIGRDATANQLLSLIDGPVSIQIGEDVMIAKGVSIRTSDSHGIFSLDDATCTINPPASVRIGSHVWLGEHCTILPGRNVGPGSIIGLRSVVTRDVPTACLVAGVPARIIRERVTWTRAMQPSLAEMARVTSCLPSFRLAYGRQ